MGALRKLRMQQGGKGNTQAKGRRDYVEGKLETKSIRKKNVADFVKARKATKKARLLPGEGRAQRRSKGRPDKVVKPLPPRKSR